jgi:hypothetical protein
MKRMFLACAIAGPLLATIQMEPVTYYRDVVPILQEHCLSCHRPGHIAPMSFISYRQTRRWADAIVHVVTTAKMPPWSAAGTPGPAQRNHALSERDINTLVLWANEGALEGNPKDAPPPAFPEEAYGIRYRTMMENPGGE